MSNKKPNTSQIIKQAEILFSLLEAEADRINDDDALAEALAEEWGHELKNSGGCSLLRYAYDLSLTESERAYMCLGEAATHMSDEALKSLTDLAYRTLRLQEILDQQETNKDFFRGLVYQIRWAAESAQEVDFELTGYWAHRAMRYRKELDQQGKTLVRRKEPIY